MKIELTKKTKIIIYSAIAVAAFALGLYLECCDSKKFEITPIPSASETPETDEKYKSHYDEEGRLDINEATVDELMELNGIGEALAERMIEYRELNGDFSYVDEITNIKGISTSLLERLKEEICVR